MKSDPKEKGFGNGQTPATLGEFRARALTGAVADLQLTYMAAEAGLDATIPIASLRKFADLVRADQRQELKLPAFPWQP